MKCDKCNKDFEERLIQSSHDIPKYIGGIDSDGRHWLCKDCHDKYDNLILIRCLNFVGEEFNFDERILWMKELSKQPEGLKMKFKEIAEDVKEEFFDG